MPTVFTRRVWKACAQIPPGQVSTYRDIARALGKPASARAVGQALNKSPGMPKVPCHRVVAADGKLGGFAWGPKEKNKRLAREGVSVAKGKIVNFERVHFRF